MSMIECPRCMGMISTLLPKCPKCGAAQKWIEAPPSARRIETDALMWARTWAHIGAWSVIAGFLIPIPIPHLSRGDLGWGALWSWDLFKSETLFPVGLTAPPLAGIAVLALLFLSRDEILPRFMTFIGAFTIVVEVALGVYLSLTFVVGESSGEEIRLDVLGPFLACALASVGAFVIAAGNRIRKTHPLHRCPRWITGIGGVLLLLLFAIPWTGRPPVAAFFSGTAWERAWMILVPLLGLLAYGIAGVACLRNFERPKRACRIVSWLGRGALLLMPVIFLILNFATVHTIRAGAPGALVVLKVFLTLYGGLVIFAAGLAALLTLRLNSPYAVSAPQPA